MTVSSESGHRVREVRLGGSYLSQAPPTLHFGLGRDRIATSIEVKWPGPGNQVSRMANVSIDRQLTIRQPAPDGHRLSVVQGSGSGVYPSGTEVPIAVAESHGNYRFSHWSVEGGGVVGSPYAARTSLTMSAGPSTVFARFLPGPASAVTKIFGGAALGSRCSCRRSATTAHDPPIHARNLFHLSAAMYDAWAAWSDTAEPWHFGDSRGLCGTPPHPLGGDVRRAREAAISHAARRLIDHRFRNSPGGKATMRNADTLMTALYDRGPASEPAAAFGACIGNLYRARGLTDGSNEANDYANRHYEPVNPELPPSVPGNPELVDPDRWQPLDLVTFVDQAGFESDDVEEFVTPEWGSVSPFALSRADLSVHRRDGADYRVFHDPGPPPTLRGPLSEHYRRGFALVARWSSLLSPKTV